MNGSGEWTPHSLSVKLTKYRVPFRIPTGKLKVSKGGMIKASQQTKDENSEKGWINRSKVTSRARCQLAKVSPAWLCPPRRDSIRLCAKSSLQNAHCSVSLKLSIDVPI
ncbi:hypothetical protein CIRG_10257 [Coccidioides immitis RMSCC 2394]|uniref:Uncharacterized protein n=1 Tax=Coccidioides immitis RMSCC 2394 TaxID=404692 RepID=A0A0J6Y5U9_COCIT|nr:hypothetical protein CIRG_10257 [Coccidioides immitis RMSCC 2394]